MKGSTLIIQNRPLVYILQGSGTVFSEFGQPDKLPVGLIWDDYSLTDSYYLVIFNLD